MPSRTTIVGFVIGGIGLVLALPIVGLAIGARTVARPSNLGVSDGQLAPCPDTPNCVSSQATDAEHAMPPIPYSIATDQAKAQIREILAEMPRVTVEQDDPDYLAVVVRSATFQFPDDVEFYFDEQAGLIHFRSASRLGKGDMGVNRKRMEQISQAFAAKTATAR